MPEKSTRVLSQFLCLSRKCWQPEQGLLSTFPETKRRSLQFMPESKQPAMKQLLIQRLRRRRRSSVPQQWQSCDRALRVLVGSPPAPASGATRDLWCACGSCPHQWLDSCDMTEISDEGSFSLHFSCRFPTLNWLVRLLM